MAMAILSGPRRKLIVAGVSLLATFIIGLLIGRFAISSQGNDAFLSGVPRAIVQEADDTIHEKLASRIKAGNIRENLRQLTSKPHLAGTPADYTQAKELADLWKQQGFDDVTITPYDVLMSYPDPENPNVVRVRGQNDEILYESPLTEAILTPRENVPGVVPPFNAYSANGTVTGNLVYVNYGRDEDFKYVTDVVNINVTGNIVIARYGKIYRGDKAKAAQKHGAIGLMIYTDPADYARGGNSSDVYPHSWWLPPTGVQRGTLFVTDGDPETPGYPSIGTAYRVPESQINLPAIPVHPISYGEAKNIMKYMSGSAVRSDWSGGMDIVYRYGPGFSNQTLKDVEMRISTRNQRNVTYNTIGIITGAVEPDRYVILGNHRDAWVFGAMDPSSGTAAMMEAARVMAEMVSSGEWRPRRSLVFCSWGAEEYGSLGSSEWVEEYMKNLGARTVAYLNVDTAVSGKCGTSDCKLNVYVLRVLVFILSLIMKQFYSKYLRFVRTAYRVPESQINLPAIPVHPISYGEAKNIMKYMSGSAVRSDWSGGMDIVYRYGPGFSNQTLKDVEMRISTRNQRNVTYNTIGIITGAVEPDRYVILGNHRDAWVFGAMDPSSGTAAMMEAARVMAEMVSSGEWRPRRSLVFCSWGAEEYGSLGSSEWVEEYMKNLGARTVAYLNVDTAVSGNYSLSMGATPLLNRPVYDAAKQVLGPRGDRSLYDEWLKVEPRTFSGQSTQPRIDPPGSGSDHDPFLLKAGIPVATFGFKSEYPYPLYHSVYETFYAMEKFYDPDFKIHACVTSLWVELARSLSDSLVLPYNVSDYGVMLEQSRKELDNNHGALLRPRIANYSALRTNIEDFQTVADDFMKQMTTINKKDPLAVRKVNDQMMQLERAFIDPAGLPGRSYFRHVFLAPSKLNIYEGSSFPGLADLIFELETSRDQDDQWERIKHHFSVLLFVIQSAASTLKDVSHFVKT
ncbi:N-acetylated-alpha-linked acidic dipeptidase 2-like [Haliotis rufescens]|uniref:N-acetylated-alpha-linked acidic dipeptidase 2-like n=1 Tax=Haliotis rufescens TaxID=6454 RepID=UPI00201F297A|nr:N-acetylated-alpha-linked acidic dipeptidase 2-like [Haliotis rufescens]